MYILKSLLGGPDDFTEYTYEDTVQVHNKIAVTDRETTMQGLLVNNYILLGEIDDVSQLDDFLGGEDIASIVTPIINPVIPPDLKLVPISELSAKYTPDASTKTGGWLPK